MDNTKSDSSYIVDYIFPKDNAQDTSPHNQRGIDHDLSNAQIEMRMTEIAEAYHALQLINTNQGELMFKRSGKINWADWVGWMRLDKVIMRDHSFGGATTVQLAREQERYPWISKGTLLDAWGSAIPHVNGRQIRVKKPLLSIGSEAFMHSPENFDTILDICKETRSAGMLCWMITINGSTHLLQTDFGVLYPRWMSWLAKNVINSTRAVHLTVKSSLEFLKSVLPVQHTFGNSWIDEGILETPSLSLKDSLPSDHKPKEKWIAARLRIPHKFQLRLMS